MSDKKNKETFTVTLEDKTEVKVAVERPKEHHLKEAQKIKNKTFSEAAASGAIVRPAIDGILRKQQVWDDTRQAEADLLQKKIMTNRMKVSQGGKISELRDLALQVRKDSAKLRELNSARNSIDIYTAEAQADSAYFNRLISLCTVYDDTGKPYFSSYEDYLSRPDDPVAQEAGLKLMYMVYNLDQNAEAKLPENKFLLQFKFVDEKLRLINKDGHLVDEDGRLINEEGRYVDAQGNYVDRDGNPIDEAGNYSPGTDAKFYDDEGNEVTPPSSPA